MKENLTELVFILDKSGSMSGLESDTIGGFNSMITKQQKEEGEAIVSTVLFSDASTVLHDRVDISKVEKMTDNDYYVGGCTALLDAVGEAIRHIGKIQKKEGENRPAKTLFVITTDGMENASRKYSASEVKKMISKKKEKHNWEFLYLGANIDAVKAAGDIGISADRAANYRYDAVGTALNYEVLQSAVSSIRRCKSSKMKATFDGGAWKEQIDEDYKARN